MPASQRSEAASEAWSVASSSIIDTRSEPPRCYGKEADKIMKRAAAGAGAAAASPSVAASGSSSKQQSSVVKNAAVPSKLERKLSSSSKTATSSKASKPAGSSASRAPSGAASEKTGRSKKSNKSEKSKTSAASTKHTKASKSSESKAKSSTSKSTNKGRTSPSPASAASPSSNRSKAKSMATQTATASATHHSCRDPESTIGTNTNYAAHQSSDPNFALVPAPQQSAAKGDPPSGASTSGSSSSTEGTPSLYDPPSSGSQNFAYAKVYKPKDEQMSVLNEEEDESTYFAKESRHDSTVASGSARSQSTRSSQTSSSSYSSDEESSRSGTHGEESDLASAVERALAIREDNRSEATSTTGGESETNLKTIDEDADDTTDAKDARALVQSEYHGGVNSYYEGAINNAAGGAIVERDENKDRYLSTAVDNHHAIVPIDSAIYEAYDHTFVTCPENLRFRFLYTFLKKNLDKKVMIFFSTTNSAKYHAKLLAHFHIPVLTMHGKQKREKFISRFFKFSDLDEGILCATDAAGRDLDIPPSVDWVIQFEPPDDPSEYILRVARISCDSDRVGRSLLFLNPGEQGFLKYYHSASIPVSEFEIPKSLSDVQSQIEYHVNESERLLRYARDAYGSYLIAYASHGFRDVYNVHDLNKADVATAFGLVGLPNICDDQTAETETLVSSYVGSMVGRGELGETKKSGGGGGGGGSGGGKKSWEKTQKPKNKSWMRGEKSWPHSQIKLHPKFKQGEVVGGSS